MSTSVLKALPGKLDIERRSPGILYLSHIHHNYAFYKLRDHFLTRHKIIMMKMTDTSFISHTPEPLKGSKSARDECKQNFLFK